MDRRSFIKASVVSGAVIGSMRETEAQAAPAGSGGFPIRVSSMDGSIGHSADVKGIETAHSLGLDGLQLQYLPELSNPNSLRHKKTMIAYRDAALNWNIQINALCIGKLGSVPLKSEPVGVVWVEEAMECANFLGAQVDRQRDNFWRKLSRRFADP